uniref:Uncharacterized protein n=1 Tax=Panagrolaimus sp. PS1159 TaxID=55785 RepID=A0AC35GBL7_9BILA
MSNTEQKINEEKSIKESEKNNVASSSLKNDDEIKKEEMIKKAKRALLVDADRFKKGIPTSSDLKRRPPTSIVNTQFLGRLLNQPNRGRIVKSTNKKTSSTKNEVKK